MCIRDRDEVDLSIEARILEIPTTEAVAVDAELDYEDDVVDAPEEAVEAPEVAVEVAAEAPAPE